MRTYELVTILSPMLNQEQAAEAWGRIKEFISNRDAEITREQSWGTRRLAYPIRKGSINFLEGSYYLTQFATERPFNFDLEVFLHRDERVLRSLVTVADPNAPPTQPGMAAAAAAAARVAAEAAAAAAAEAAPAEAPAEEVADAEAAVLADPAAGEPVAGGEPMEEPVVEVAAEPETVMEPAMEVEPVSEPESPAVEERSEG